MINKFAVALTLLFALLIGGITWAAFHYAGKSAAAQATVSTLQSSVTLQATEIDTQSAQFQSFNQAAATALQTDQQNSAVVEKTQIEYRTVLKSVPTCALNVPASVTDGLLGYTNKLRADALNTDPSVANSSNSSATTASTLTYCQAVLWITPLLSAIETANNHLAAIRQIELQRQKTGVVTK